MVFTYHPFLGQATNSSSDRKEQASQNASPQIPRGPASEWSVEEVIQYITATDPALDVHAKLFRDHVSFVLPFFIE